MPAKPKRPISPPKNPGGRPPGPTPKHRPLNVRLSDANAAWLDAVAHAPGAKTALIDRLLTKARTRSTH